MLLVVEHGLVDESAELPALGRDASLGDQPDQLLVLAPVADEVGDGDQRQVVLLGEALEVGQAGHLRLVLGHDFAQDPGGREAGGPAEIHRRLGVPRPLEDPAGAVAQREDVPGPVEVVRPRRRVDQRGNGGGPVGRRDPRRGAVAEVDAHRERRALRLRVGGDHQRQVESVGPLGQQRHADDPGRVGEEEGDVLGRGRLAGHDEVAFVLPVLVVDHHGHAEAADGVDGFAHGREAHQAATSTRMSSPSRSTETSLPLHTSSIVPAPGPEKSGRPSSPPKKAGARYRT